MSIIPNTTASMITAPSTAFGRCENTGASTTSVARTSAPVVERGHRRARAGRLVERAGRQARRHGHALEHARADVRHALRHRLLVDVDAVAVARGERARVAGGLREADQQQRRRRDARSSRSGPGRASRSGSSGAGKPARHVADERDAVRAEVEQRRGDQAADDQHERARNRRRQESQRQDHAERDRARRAASSSGRRRAPEPGSELAPGVVAFGGRAGQLRQLADHHVDRGAREEAGDHRLRQEARDPAQAEDGEQRGTAARSRV